MEINKELPRPSLLRRILTKLIVWTKWFLIVSISSVIVFRFVPIPLTPSMVYLFIVQIVDGDREVTFHKDWESLDNISENMQVAVVSAEDQLFYSHSGFDYDAIKKAIRSNDRGRKLKGGSTISQQTAKNTFLLPHRNYIRKGFEVYFTFLIELLWSKDRIMEVYLNVIEFGNGIYGVEAASKYYFKKSAKDLSKQECASLAAVLPNPIIYKVKNPSKYTQKKKRWILRQMGHFGNIKALKDLRVKPVELEIDDVL